MSQWMALMTTRWPADVGYVIGTNVGYV